MKSKEVLEYESFREELFEKAMKIAKEKFPERYFSYNHHPFIDDEGVYFPSHDGMYMLGSVVITWEELGVADGNV